MQTFLNETNENLKLIKAVVICYLCLSIIIKHLIPLFSQMLSWIMATMRAVQMDGELKKCRFCIVSEY